MAVQGHPRGLRCVRGSAQAVPQAVCAHRKRTPLISAKAECVCSLIRKVHVFSEDVLALGGKFDFSLKFPGWNL